MEDDHIKRSHPPQEHWGYMERIDTLEQKIASIEQNVAFLSSQLHCIDKSSIETHVLLRELKSSLSEDFTGVRSWILRLEQRMWGLAGGVLLQAFALVLSYVLLRVR